MVVLYIIDLCIKSEIRTIREEGPPFSPGGVGGLLPAIRAARMSINAALREA
jgi:hypothetical protein